jgi:hypothetical protein
MGQETLTAPQVITVAELKALSPSEFAALPVEQLRAFTKEHMACLSEAQLQCMTDEKLHQAWTATHLNALSTMQGVCLGKALYLEEQT